MCQCHHGCIPYQTHNVAFRTSLKDSTKIIIAQRITSVMEADQIVVVNEGRVTGVGSHDALLASNAEYKEIYDSQMEAAKQKAELEKEINKGEVTE